MGLRAAGAQKGEEEMGIPATEEVKKISEAIHGTDFELPLALASDYNPGSTPSGNMKFVMSLACIKMRLTPNEAINATTINTAAAMGISNTHGSIAVGKQANFYITKPISSIDFIPYAYNTPIVKEVYLNGKRQ